MKVQRGLTCSAALLSILTLAACAGSPEAGTVDAPTSAESASTEPETTEPSDAETTEPSQEPTEDPPVLKEVAGEEPEITFAKHFFDVYMYSRRTGDVEPFLALGQPDCASCISASEWLTDIYDAGGHIEGGVYKLVGEPLLVRNVEPTEVRLSFKESAATLIETPGADPQHRPECEVLRYRVQMAKEGDQWLVDQFTVQSPCD